MSSTQFVIVADPESGTLCRILGIFAQLGLAPPNMTVIATPKTMTLSITTELEEPLAAIVERKVDSFVGVHCVSINAAD